jgi:transcription elongation factor Elf1
MENNDKIKYAQNDEHEHTIHVLKKELESKDLLLKETEMKFNLLSDKINKVIDEYNKVIDEYNEVISENDDLLAIIDSKNKEIKELKEKYDEKMDTTQQEYSSLNKKIMNVIEDIDRKLLENDRIANMSRIDWGKTMAVSNQFIQRNILRYMLEPYGYSVYSTDDADMPSIDIANNSPGFDLIIVTPPGKHIRVQSKLRQVKGINDYSQQIHFETTRRNSEKNKDKNHTGHICYSLDEFDLVMVSLVNDRLDRNKIKNCDLWSYSLIPIKELEDAEHKCCYSHIKPEILEKNIVKITDDIRDKII